MEITNKPFLMSFAGNPMRYLLTPGSGGGGGGGIDPIDGIPSIIEIVFSDIDSTPDHAVEVTFMGATRTFTLKNEPSTKDHLPIADDGGTAADWAQICYDYIIRDVQLTEVYDITNDAGDKIILTAKNCETQYDWTEGTKTIVGVTITTTQNGAAGTAGTTGTVEGVLMSVYKNPMVLLGQDYKPLDQAGSVKFEIQEYINSILLMATQPRFHLAYGTAHHFIFSDAFLKYLTVFCNRVDGVFQSRTYSAGYAYAITGGLNREDLVYNNFYATDYFNLTTTKKKFLTWAPPAKITDKVETHSLFFAFQAPAHTHFKMKAHLYSNIAGTTIDCTGLYAVTPYTVVEFFAGYAQLGLSASLDGNVYKWEMYLVDESDNVISDIRSFEIDPKYYENVRYFRFRNSWGTYDSLRCTGSFELIVENDREKVIFLRDDAETQYNSPGAHTLIKESQTFKANSGWLTKDFLNYLRDFMLSSDIFEVEDSKLLKCLLTSKKTSMFKDTNYNYALAFEYERAWDDFFFQGLE